MQGRPRGPLSSTDSPRHGLCNEQSPAHAREEHKPRPVPDTRTLKDSPCHKCWGRRVEGLLYGQEDPSPCAPGVYLGQRNPLRTEPQLGLGRPEATAEPLTGAAAADRGEGSGTERKQAAAWGARDPVSARGLPDPALPPPGESSPAHGPPRCWRVSGRRNAFPGDFQAACHRTRRRGVWAAGGHSLRRPVTRPGLCSSEPDPARAWDPVTLHMTLLVDPLL